jgi:hypothetical protein
MDPDLGGPKTYGSDGPDPDSDPQHWFFKAEFFYWRSEFLIERGNKAWTWISKKRDLI